MARITYCPRCNVQSDGCSDSLCPGILKPQVIFPRTLEKRFISPTDFVIVRFATKRYRFMRFGHFQIDVWLRFHKIEYTRVRESVYFQLPDEMQLYTVITKELAERLAPFATIIKQRLSAISWSAMRRYREPLTYEECQALAESNIVVVL